MRVLFADVEGQGDRDAAYDARLASAILPLTKCVIFNWRDSLQVDRMLNLLGVMQRAAHNVDLGELFLVFPRVVFCFLLCHVGRAESGRACASLGFSIPEVGVGFRLIRGPSFFNFRRFSC